MVCSEYRDIGCVLIIYVNIPVFFDVAALIVIRITT